MKKLTIPLFLLLICGLRLGAQQINGGQIYFQSYTSASERLTSQPMYVSCPTNYSVALNQGTYGTSVTNRMMKASNGNTMQYQLFTDATYSTNWGNTTGSEVTGTSANGINVYVYAQIPALQAFSPSGNFRYSDTVTATLTCGSTQINSTISVQVQEVDTGCGISASDLSFGNYTGTALNATTTIQVGCSNGTYNVGLSAGTATGATVSNRSMTLTGGITLLKYDLLRGSYTGSNWGQTIGTDTVTGSGTGFVQSLIVYGKIPAGQSVAQGTYTDTITATITY